MRMLRLDATAATYLPVCSCGWRGASIYLDKHIAWKAGDRHVSTCHPDDTTARLARHKRDQRLNASARNP